jgi:hypothetical protein
LEQFVRSGQWEAAPELYSSAVRGALGGGELSAEAEAQLAQIRSYLELTPEAAAEGDKLIEEAKHAKALQIFNDQRAIQRKAWLQQLREGRAEISLPANVILRKGERCLFSVGGTALEEKVVRRDYVGGSRGVSIRVAKGISFRVGASKGQSAPVYDLVEIADGQLIITNRRIIFQGNPKSFSDLLENLIDVSPGSQGLRYNVTNRSKPRLVRYAAGTDYEAVLAALDGALKSYGS